MSDINNFELPPVISAIATCHINECEFCDVVIPVEMIEGSLVTCGGCWNVITDLVISV